MALIKGFNSIYPGECFLLLPPGKWALKPNASRPTPHVEGAGLAVDNTTNTEQTMWLERRPRALLNTGVWLGPRRQSVVNMAAVWCVQVVNSSKRLVLISGSVVVRKTLMLVRERLWAFPRLLYGFVSCQTWCKTKPPPSFLSFSSQLRGLKKRVGQLKRPQLSALKTSIQLEHS